MVTGGRTLYGFPVGMVMTDSRFPRVPGDNGHAATWPFPMLYRSVLGAEPGRVVRRLSEAELLAPFIEASLELERAGVQMVTTSCGFLVLFQRRMQEHLSVPFLSSSLLQAPWGGVAAAAWQTGRHADDREAVALPGPPGGGRH